MKKLFILMIGVALFLNSTALAQKGARYTTVSDSQMESFLSKLDQDTGRRYSGLISKVRQAWLERNTPAFNSLSRQLAYLLLRGSYHGGKYQPMGSCQQLGGSNCYCGVSISCCCFYPCSVFVNICVGVDYGAIVAGAGGGGGGSGGGGEYFICRPPQDGRTR